ncbi:DUF4435 domain-containing protein [Pseudomonas asiatica]|uniref:DUF4435 domain-containing protein n=1 Tax=Pseudomonas asiatica TaxID=2219225 RepID=UPI0021F7A161|nr:DUF4435 domain-containing protein [Pseudomonas asiatica]UYP81159.1 DUF4435 domain-containing protein [Pseudomonas asiatica]
MRKYLGVTDKHNEIRLLFSHPLYKDKTIVIVEGGSDIRFFRDIINYSWVKLESIDGKKELIKLMKALSPEFPEKILGICDADHDRLLPEVEDRELYSVYVTDYHDAEIMMLNSPALTSFISEFSTPDHFEEARDKILESTLSAANVIGTLRWASTELGINLKFKGLNFGEFVTANEFDVTVDTDKLIDLLIARSDSIPEGITKELILSKLDEFIKRDACKLQVCCGHDASNIISIIFRQRNLSLETNMDHRKVESALRLGYQQEYFRRTRLFEKVYEKLNTLNIAAGELA